MAIFFLTTKKYSDTLLLRASLETGFTEIFLTDLPAFRPCLPLKDICYLYSGRHGSGSPKYALLCALPLPHSQKGIRKTLK
jgi:hypothetical protein